MTAELAALSPKMGRDGGRGMVWRLGDPAWVNGWPGAFIVVEIAFPAAGAPLLGLARRGDPRAGRVFLRTQRVRAMP